VQPTAPSVPIGVSSDIHSPLSVDVPLNKTIPPTVAVLKGFPPPGQLSGPLSGVGNDLSDHGIHVGILLDDFFLHEISTGRVSNASMNSGDIKYSVTLDLDRILGIPNTTLNIDETQYILSHHAFGFVLYSNSYFFPGAGGYDTTMLSRFSIQSSLLNHHLDVEVGRINPIFYFMQPTFCGLCFNGTQARNADFPGPDAQAWGGRVAYHVTPSDTVQIGAFENDLYIFQHTNGWDFSTKHATGYIGALNYVHRTSFFDNATPVRLEIGMFHNSARYTDPVLNTDGTSQFQNPFGKALVHLGGYTGVYAQIHKTVWSQPGALGNPFAKNLALFGSIFVTPGQGVSYPLEIEAGSEFANFIPNHPFWTLGGGVHYAMIGTQKALAEQQIRVLIGGPNIATPRNMTSPFAYLFFPVTQYAIGQAFAEYYFNQDSSYIPAPTPPKNGWFVGFRVTLDIGKALGLSAGGMPF
jgi:porin